MMTQQGNSNSRGMRMADEESRWHAVLARDPSFDGAFVYAVRSTGIYCRPWCPARRPRRQEVLFFPEPADAEQAGFRACRRCQPRDGSPHHPQAALIERVCRYIEANVGGLEGSLTLDALSAEAGVSAHHLQRTFKRIMGITPHEYAESCRLGELKNGLKKGKDVTSALYEAGYSSSSRLYEGAPARLGMTPATYGRGGRSMRINYTISDSPLGRLLVAATERGVCAVSLGDSDAALEAFLRHEYPSAEIRRDRLPRGGLNQAVSRILNHLKGQGPSLHLSLDLQATAFQWRVWKELCSIPYGATRSYSQVARAIGRPKAVRAVARAIATNPVAVVIPCHRVVHQDGSLSGYRWGTERKRALLEKERIAATDSEAKDVRVVSKVVNGQR